MRTESCFVNSQYIKKVAKVGEVGGYKIYNQDKGHLFLWNPWKWNKLFLDGPKSIKKWHFKQPWWYFNGTETLNPCLVRTFACDGREFNTWVVMHRPSLLQPVRKWTVWNEKQSNNLLDFVIFSSSKGFLMKRANLTKIWTWRLPWWLFPRLLH